MGEVVMKEAEPSRARVLVISHDKVGQMMAGPGIRYHAMASELAKHFTVTLGVWKQEHLPEVDPGYARVHLDDDNFAEVFDQHDVILAFFLARDMVAYARAHGKRLVFDLYTPVHIEGLANAIYSDDASAPSHDEEALGSVDVYARFFRHGDLFLCSNERQRDMWLGFAMASKAALPVTYLQRPLYDLIRVAPMGIDEVPPVHSANVLRGVVPGLGADDFILVWTGGIWNWFDGVGLIEAMRLLQDRAPRIKLVFFGTRHPNPAIPVMHETKQTLSRAEQYGLVGRNVFFTDGWIPFEERINYLLEADAAIYTHKLSVETRYSHRSRVLDHISAICPTVATRGDHFAEVIERQELGTVAEPENPAAIADAIVALSTPETLERCRRNVQAVRAEYTWGRTLRPLLDYLATVSPGESQPVPLDPELVPDSAMLRRAKRLVPEPTRRALKKWLRRA